MPDYLRTKLDLDLERHQQRLQKEAEKLEATGNVQQLVTDHNSMLSSVVDIVSAAREDWPEYTSKLGQSIYKIFLVSSVSSTAKVQLLHVYMYTQSCKNLHKRLGYLNKVPSLLNTVNTQNPYAFRFIAGDHYIHSDFVVSIIHPLEDSSKNRSVETRKLVHIVLRGEGTWNINVEFHLMLTVVYLH